MKDQDKYQFKTETGIVVSQEGDALAIIDGTPGHVEFPEEFIWQTHKMRPGYVYKLAHTHPTGMTQLSERDKQTLKTWAFALHPFNLRMSTITLIGKDVFKETTYAVFLEPKETWIARGKKEERKIEIITEHEYDFIDPRPLWMQIILNRSFEKVAETLKI